MTKSYERGDAGFAELYEQCGKNSGDVVVLGIANPSSTEYPNNGDEN